MSLTDLRSEFRTTKLEGTDVQKQELVVQCLVRICDVLNIEGREPDRWEVTQVLAALGALQAGFYFYAFQLTDHAMAPPEERSEEWRVPQDGVTRQQLEYAIYCERQRPPAAAA